VPRARPRPASVAAAVVVAGLATAGLTACGGGNPLASSPPASGRAPITTPTTVPVPPTPPATVAPHKAVTAPTVPPGATPTTTVPPGAGPKTAVTAPTITAGRDGSALLHSVLARAIGQGWVHGVSTSPPAQAGEGTTTFTSDDGPTRGTQNITIGAVAGQIRVVGDRTYILGTPTALQVLFMVPASVAPALGGRWVTLVQGDSDYHSVTVGVTISSFIDEIAFDGKVTAGTTTHDGTTVTILEGRLATADGQGTGVLYLSGGTDPLPSKWEEIGTKGATTITTFTRWGRPVTVTAPSGSVRLPAAPGGTATIATVRPG
jgi:hypothetical protein